MLDLLARLGMTAGAALSGGLSNTRAARTQRTSSTSNQGFRNGTRRALRPEQEALMGPLFGRATALMERPGEGLEPVRVARRDGINATYGGVVPALRDRMLSSGVTASGKYGRAVREAEMARLGQLNGLDGEIAQLVLSRQDAGTSLAQTLLGMGFGTDNSGDQWGSQEGTGVAPGSAVAGGLGQGLQTLMALTTMDRMLQGGGGGWPSGWPGL